MWCVEFLWGGWVSTHTYGWTQFDIDAEIQAPTITTYSIDYYSEEQLLADPSSVAGLEPRVVSQFVVYPDAADNAADPAMMESQGDFVVELQFLFSDTFMKVF